MKEIVDRLTENRQIAIAKSILESNGYKVEKSRRLKESVSPDDARAEIVSAWSYGWGGTPRHQNNSHRAEEQDIYAKYDYQDEYDADDMSDEDVLAMYNELDSLYKPGLKESNGYKVEKSRRLKESKRDPKWKKSMNPGVAAGKSIVSSYYRELGDYIADVYTTNDKENPRSLYPRPVGPWTAIIKSKTTGAIITEIGSGYKTSVDAKRAVEEWFDSHMNESRRIRGRRLKESKAYDLESDYVVSDGYPVSARTVMFVAKTPEEAAEYLKSNGYERSDDIIVTLPGAGPYTDNEDGDFEVMNAGDFLYNDYYKNMY